MYNGTARNPTRTGVFSPANHATFPVIPSQQVRVVDWISNPSNHPSIQTLHWKRARKVWSIVKHENQIKRLFARRP
jgi:hypothetical protein